MNKYKITFRLVDSDGILKEAVIQGHTFTDAEYRLYNYYKKAPEKVDIISMEKSSIDIVIA